MKRAQGILKRWKEQVELDKTTTSSVTAPLTYLLELEYKKYVDLCYWCYETPLSYSKWLSQDIN